MKKIFLLLSLLLCLGLTCCAQDRKYVTTVHEMLKVSGSMEVFTMTVDQVISTFRGNMNTSVPDSFWQDLRKELTSVSVDELTVMLAPIYYKYLTQGELEETIAFYKSQTGKKYREVTPQITKEAYSVGAAWGEKLARKVIQRIQEKGYRLN